ncbi:MAG: acyl carrier protein [Candidatus Omnitrophica bacterium]|nr:acyl carrier protein [Candidatus Omnitrophota bacterium]
METSLFGEIKKVISEQLGVQSEEIGPKTSLIADLGVDSLDTLELVMALEERFRIEIPEEDVEGMKTAGDVVSYVESKMSLKN